MPRAFVRHMNRAATIISTTLALGTAALFAVAQQKGPSAPSAAQVAFFESKIRPLFLTSCVSCHGKDAQQGGLRLDGPIPLEKAQEVLRRVKGEGGKPRMPVGGELPKDKIAAIEEWVSTGAAWPAAGSSPKPVNILYEKGKTHWAFQKIKQPPVPKVKNAAWVRNAIDAFVLKKLEEKGLKPAPVASRAVLIRRLTYDLTGLPPTPDEVAAFESDTSPNAYEKLVDRLLASPHYGEKWARSWLDLVRYAETNSYERDNPKPYIYKYRDYVIRAFNDDKPYDRFVKEQLAGDEMVDAPGDAVLATAYYRLGIWDDEPADKLQAQYDDLDDIIATTGQAFLGLTLDCARCHDHKLDPIPQRDYYRMLAIFHNINRYKNGGSTDEARYFASMDAKREWDRMSAEIADKRKSNVAELKPFEAKLVEKGIINPGDLKSVSYKYYERDWKRIPDFENEPVIASGNIEPPRISLSPRQRNEEFAIEYDGKLNVPADGDYTFTLYAEGGYRLAVGGERLFESFASDGKGVEKSKKKHLGKGETGINLIFNQRQKQHGLVLTWSGPGFVNRALSPLDSCGEGGLPIFVGPDAVKTFGKETVDKVGGMVDRLAELEKQAPRTEKVLCVTEAGSKVPETTILLRGVPTNKGDKVDPGTPECAGGGVLSAAPPANGKSTGLRTQLANWIASPNNPLTARVIVNRIWQGHFGRGIVRTPNDFGLQGAAPTHPELIDWLASEFIRRGWSFKALHRLILTSNTYKQSSRNNPAALAADPQNDLLWRFDMRRLTAEEIRDSLLAVCGNINYQMFGPSVYPEIAKEILAGQSRPGKDWFMERMSAEDVCRRSIYVSEKRSLIYPLFASFDMPETDRPSPTRFASTQPTQALGTMNGALFNKQAAILAARVRKEAGEEPRAFSRRLLSLVTQRTPTEMEIGECVALMDRLIKHGAKPEQAQNYACLTALNLDEFFYLD